MISFDRDLVFVDVETLGSDAVVPGAVAGHERRMTAYTAFLALVRNGFRPPTGAGRCRACACHVATQGHRDGCPERGK